MSARKHDKSASSGVHINKVETVLILEGIMIEILKTTFLLVYSDATEKFIKNLKHGHINLVVEISTEVCICCSSRCVQKNLGSNSRQVE